jgi:tetratricopeptide (TPR) repeat protein
LLYNDASTDRLIREAMHANYDLRFDEARKLTQRLQQAYPDHPVGYLLAAESCWWEAQTDPKNREIEQAYYAAQKAAAERGIEALKHDKYAKIELLSYLASSYGSLARFQVTNKSAYFSALRAGRKALDYARQVYAMDPEYYDVYTGLGAYNYFTATLPAVIKPFAFLIGGRGQKELGFEQLRLAMEKSRYSRTEANIVYYSVLLEEKRYADALRLLEELMGQYPDNFVFYKWAASLFETQHQVEDGIQYLNSVAERQLVRSPTLATHALIRKAYLEHTAGQDAQAKQTLERIKSIPETDRLAQSQITTLEKALK